MSFFRRQISEIEASRALVAFGAGLAFVNILTFTWWWRPDVVETLSDNWLTRTCWPALPCEWMPALNSGQVRAALLFYLFCAIGTFFLFWARKITVAFVALIFTTLVKLSIFSLDARIMGNYHFMPFLATAAFLFVPRKVPTLKALVMAFYLAAGALKLNREWLSGGAIPESYVDKWFSSIFYSFHGKLVLAGAFWVVILELIVIWGLVSRHNSVRWATLANLLLFHAISFGVVGYFYPGVMVCLLVIFPMTWRDPGAAPIGVGGISFLVIFFLLQLHPLAIGKNAEITGEGRWYSLNMFDANIQCDPVAVMRWKNRSVELTDLSIGLSVRIGCDPYYFYEQLRSACRDHKDDEDFLDLDFYLVSRHKSDKSFRFVVNQKNFCHKNLSYSSLVPNAWIE